MGFVWLLILLVIIAIYFIPTIIAYDNKTNNRTQVLIINIFLGRTLIGWVVALVMAIGKDEE